MFLNAAFPRATALLLYHIVSGLSILLDVEHSLLFLSMICENSIKRAFPLPEEKRSTLFFIEKQPFIRRFSHHTLATTHSSARNKQSSADMPSAAHTTAHRLAVIIIVQLLLVSPTGTAVLLDLAKSPQALLVLPANNSDCGSLDTDFFPPEIGRASCRERV